MAQKLNKADVLSHLTSHIADIQAFWPHFDVRFIIHRRGQRHDEIIRTLADLNGHPCQKAAQNLLLGKVMPHENSAFIGLAIGHEKRLFGLRRQAKYLSLISLNIDTYSKLEDCLFEAYHFMAHAMDTMNLVEAKNLEASSHDIILQPKRNQLSLSRVNLKADAFSGLMMTASGFANSIRNLALQRSLKTLTPQISYRPEDYPYPMSLDVTEYASQSLKENNRIFSVYQTASKVAGSFDKHNLLAWAHFAMPAQIMAWNEEKPEDILSAAVYICADPFVKATGHMVSEITGLEPSNFGHAAANINPFADDQINRINHLRLAEETFGLAIIDALEAESNLPLIRVANSQNEELLKGKVLGWCAHALHSAAKAFEFNLKSGLSFAQAASLQFQSMVHEPDWKSMQSLNGFVLAQRRNGYAVTLTDVTDWCSSRTDLKPVMQAVNLTLADPGFNSKLTAANDLPMPGPRATPAAAPKAAPIVGPAYGAAPQMTLGGGMGGHLAGGNLSGNRMQTPPHPVETIDDE